MLNSVLNFIFGSKYERDIKRLKPIVEKINSLEDGMKGMSDNELSALTGKFKERIAAGETLDDLLPEAFAAVREAAWRTMGMRHFDVQLMGGIALHWGNISEMKTGEGKTLTSTLPVYLNSLSGKGVHIVTVNDYLAKRDATWMKPIYDFMGVSVGVIQHDMEHEDRQAAYNADITYGTNNEYGFDYLRDNMVSRLEHKVQRYHNYAIVDEVDSILIDEARTPLIISGPADENTEIYYKVNKIIPRLKEIVDYEIDEKAKNALLTEEGVRSVEKILGVDNLYDPENVALVHHVHQALKAHKIFQKDVDYVVQNGEVIIVDEFTGRLMPGRRYSDGLHQSLEAKENVQIARESQTLASITFQNYFRIYSKLAGMTGTADTEAEEFGKIYKLDVIVIPPNLKVQRIDHGDRVYRTEKEKFDAIVREIRECNAKKQPVLVGTISIEKSELLSRTLTSNGIPHNVLNAKFHEKEAQIVEDAGKPGKVTIATNMAGRGTDIVLGGARKYLDEIEEWDVAGAEEFRMAIRKQNFEHAAELLEGLSAPNKKNAAKILEEAVEWRKDHDVVVNAGGLHILGTERHESRRIDNQLRGRSGRQGDPGSSRFYLSLQDDLMRIFGSDRISNIMQRLNMPEGQEIEHKMVSNAIARAQKRVEGHNFDIRKHLLEYDDVMNRQRTFVYEIRNSILEHDDISPKVKEYVDEVIESEVLNYCESSNTSSWEIDALNEWLNGMNLPMKISHDDFKKSGNPQLEVFEKIKKNAFEFYLKRQTDIGLEIWRSLERNIFLDILDHRWKEHLYAMDHLREGIWTVGYGEKNPLVEYKLQGFRMFNQMVDSFKAEVVNFLFRVEVTETTRIPVQEIEYEKIGQEIHGENILSPDANLNQHAKPGRVTTTSAGGGSERKSSRRKKK